MRIIDPEVQNQLKRVYTIYLKNDHLLSTAINPAFKSIEFKQLAYYISQEYVPETISYLIRKGLGLPIFISKKWTNPDYFTNENTKMKDSQMPVFSTSEEEAIKDKYKNWSYSDLHNRLKKLNKEIEKKKYRTIDNVFQIIHQSYGEDIKSSSFLAVPLIEWSLGFYPGCKGQYMYPIDSSCVTVSGEKFNLTSVNSDCLKIVQIFDDYSLNKRKEEISQKIIIAKIIEHIIDNKEEDITPITKIESNDGSKKSGRKKHNLAQKDSVREIIEDCYQHPDFIHSKGQYKGKPNWTKIARKIMRAHQWDDSDIDIKTLKRRAKEIFSEFSEK